jgi:hypothetical protein
VIRFEQGGDLRHQVVYVVVRHWRFCIRYSGSLIRRRIYFSLLPEEDLLS